MTFKFLQKKSVDAALTDFEKKSEELVDKVNQTKEFVEKVRRQIAPSKKKALIPSLSCEKLARSTFDISRKAHAVLTDPTHPHTQSLQLTTDHFERMNLHADCGREDKNFFTSMCKNNELFPDTVCEKFYSTCSKNVSFHKDDPFDDKMLAEAICSELQAAPVNLSRDGQSKPPVNLGFLDIFKKATNVITTTAASINKNFLKGAEDKVNETVIQPAKKEITDTINNPGKEVQRIGAAAQQVAKDAATGATNVATAVGTETTKIFTDPNEIKNVGNVIGDTAKKMPGTLNDAIDQADDAVSNYEQNVAKSFQNVGNDIMNTPGAKAAVKTYTEKIIPFANLVKKDIEENKSVKASLDWFKKKFPPPKNPLCDDECGCGTFENKEGPIGIGTILSTECNENFGKRESMGNYSKVGAKIKSMENWVCVKALETAASLLTNDATEGLNKCTPVSLTTAAGCESAGSAYASEEGPLGAAGLTIACAIVATAVESGCEAAVKTAGWEDEFKSVPKALQFETYARAICNGSGKMPSPLNFYPEDL